jgi:cell division topological specificity factor
VYVRSEPEKAGVIMGVFQFITGRKKPTPGEVAKERLKVVLSHDRIKVNPELLEQIKADLLTVISRRLEVDEQHVQVQMAREDHWDKLHADVPIKRQKISFEWDPPAYTPAADVLQNSKLRVDVERIEEE